jgi:hypothetical protein
MLTILTRYADSGLHERVLQFGRSRRLARVSLSQVLAQYLMEVSVPDRVRAVQEFCLEGAEGCLLDHIEILFDPQLQVDPLRWLEQRARDREIFVVWPGEYDGQKLSHAEPGHPEHQKFDLGGFAAIKTECI